MFAHLTTQLIDFLFPKPEEIYDLESLNASDLMSLLPPATDLGDEVIAIFNYADPKVRQIIWELKYRKNTLLAKHLAEIAFDILKHELAERALFENFVDPLLIPMPASAERRAERGWNQTEILAEEMLKLDMENLLTYSPFLLIKFVHTKSQTKTLNKRARLQNVEHSMTVKDPTEVKGRCIILLDDVTTTGATFKDARRALKEAGARKILCLAIAH